MVRQRPGAARSRALAVCLVGLLVGSMAQLVAPATPVAQPSATASASRDAIRLDPEAPSADLLVQLVSLRGGAPLANPTALARLADHRDTLVRSGLCRLLAVRPELEPDGLLVGLVDDAEASVAILALLGLSNSRHPEALDTLAGNLSAAESWRREFAAVAIHVREELAAEAPELAVPAELVAASRPHVVSAEATAWLRAVEHHRRLAQADRQWLELQRRLQSVRTASATSACADLVLFNRALLRQVDDAAGGEYPVEYLGRPATAQIRTRRDNPSTLLLEGRHEMLADLLFAELDRVQSLEHFVDELASACRGWSPPLRELPPSSLVGRGSSPSDQGDRISSVDLWAGMSIGVTSHPFAYRPGPRNFIVGEDVEFTLLPSVELSWRDVAAGQPDATDHPVRGEVLDGYRLGLGVGGYLSTSFFDERSRPTAYLRFETDTTRIPEGDRPETGLEAVVAGRLSAGGEDVARDVSAYPAAHAKGSVGLTWSRHHLASSGVVRDRSLGLSVAYLEHVFDDSANPPRERRWMESEFQGLWLFGDPLRQTRLGAVGDASVRAVEALDRLSVLSANLGPLLRWTGSLVRLEAWMGGGLTVDLASDDPDALPPSGEDPATVELAPVGGLDLLVAVPGTSFRWAVDFSLERRALNLGRNGRRGLRERAGVALGMAFSEAMSEDLRLGLFVERTVPADSDDAVGWGGTELFIPVALVDFAAQITYEMRYMALIDESRYNDRSQEVFEALLTAGSWF